MSRRGPDPRNVALVYTKFFAYHGLENAQETINDYDEYIKSHHAAYRLHTGEPGLRDGCIHVDDECNQPPCIGCTMPLD